MTRGAPSSSILWLVLRGTTIALGIGTLLGAMASVGAARAISHFLYGIGPIDPTSFVIAGATLFLTAVTAASIPAWRATRTEPVRSLRNA